MNRERILSALTSAISNLENSIVLASNKKEEEISDVVWQACADVEYSLFLLSLLRSEETERFALSRRFSSKQKEMPALSSALDMLIEARGNVENGALVVAQEDAWRARNYLFSVQEILEKSRKIGVERASTTRS